MTSLCLPKFWDQYNALSDEVRAHARHQFDLWLGDSAHPSLHFKLVKGTKDWWSVRIGLNFRPLCIRDGDICVWLFIGNHQDYDRAVP